MANPPSDPEAAEAFYRALMLALQRERIDFLVGGAWGFAHFTGIRRPTKDLDLFVRRDDWAQLEALAAAHGWQVELTFEHWLGKVKADAGFADVIFSSGNGLSPVDDGWFANAAHADVLGVPARLAPVEETLWTKAFIMERERYDGADVAHLLHARAPAIDWPRLLSRFGEHWRVLLSHLVLYGFIYPAERSRVPPWVMDELTARLAAETRSPAPAGAQCAGTLLSREQYLPDVAHRGYDDVRLEPDGAMTAEQVARWTQAIADDGEGAQSGDVEPPGDAAASGAAAHAVGTPPAAGAAAPPSAG